MRQAITNHNYTWIDIIEPKDEDIQYLKDKFRIHPLTASTIIPAIHYPDLDQFKNYLFIILHYPHRAEKGEIKIREFDFVAGHDYLVTSHQEEITPLRQVFDNFNNPEARRSDYINTAGYILFSILNTFLKEVLAKTNDIVKEIDQIESKIFTGEERKMVVEISILKMKTLDFWRIVEPQRMIFESLRVVGTNFYGPEYRHYFVILYRVHRRIENTLKNAKETIEALEQTNHILVTVKTNEVIRVLTVFSVIFMPLTLLASIWGMNTNFLPFHGTDQDFLFIMAIMAATLFSMLAYFSRKKWL
jgi:magnesium transporter